MKKAKEVKDIIEMVKVANITEAVWYADKARKLIKKYKLDRLPNKTSKNGVYTKEYLMRAQMNMVIFEAKKRIVELTNNEGIVSLI